MNVSERDNSILKHIIDYCDQIEEAVSRFGDEFELFDQDVVYRNSNCSIFLSILFFQDMPQVFLTVLHHIACNSQRQNKEGNSP